MQIFNIHKQAEYTQNNGHVSPIVIELSGHHKGPCKLIFS